jgi:hypothetical protein
MIKDKSYRSLASKESKEQYSGIFVKLCIEPVGLLCNHCVNKLNRIRKLNGDIQTKVALLTQERDNLLDVLKQMPGVVKMYQRTSTPKRGEKRPLTKQTPTPRSRTKRGLFQTPNRPSPTKSLGLAHTSPKACKVFVGRTPSKIFTTSSKVDKSTQTKQKQDDFDVKVNIFNTILIQ